MNTAGLEVRIDEHLAQLRHDVDIETLREHFTRHGYVKLPRLVPMNVYQMVEDEIMQLIDASSQRIDIEIAETGSTPRRMRTIGRDTIHRGSRTVPELYRSASLRNFLADVAGASLYECPWEHEQYVAIRQTEPGDTHGWHWGDYAFTVIWILEAPEDESIGGALQCIPHTQWNKEDPQLEQWLADRTPDTWWHAAGDVYFLRSDTTLHRTVPLTSPSRRTILNTCWASLEDTQRAATHETMTNMFSEVS